MVFSNVLVLRVFPSVVCDFCISLTANSFFKVMVIMVLSPKRLPGESSFSPWEHTDEVQFSSSFHSFCPLSHSKGVRRFRTETKLGVGTPGSILNDVKVALG